MERGLRLSKSKTRVVHLSEGFNFLGFNVRQYPAPKTSRSGWKLLIKPSREAIKKFRHRMKMEWRALQGHNIVGVLKRLNPIIQGWGRYYRVCVARRAFDNLDRSIFTRAVRWARLMHPNKPWKWIVPRYFHVKPKRGEAQWCFGNQSPKNTSLASATYQFSVMPWYLEPRRQPIQRYATTGKIVGVARANTSLNVTDTRTATRWVMPGMRICSSKRRRSACASSPLSLMRRQ